MGSKRSALRRRDAADGLSQRAVAYFFVGPDNTNRAFSNVEIARPVWLEHEARLLSWWENGVPANFEDGVYQWITLLGTGPQQGKPWAWWKFSAPEPRHLLSVYDGAQRPPTDAERERARELGMGRSRSEHEHADGKGFLFESDEAYFARVLGITPRQSWSPVDDDPDVSMPDTQRERQ